jgi:hypothetical protein
VHGASPAGASHEPQVEPDQFHRHDESQRTVQSASVHDGQPEVDAKPDVSPSSHSVSEGSSQLP